jgi:formylglycine-generating enzyme required for sulfatase activity/tRNA A-37 threonylcarbamoyl transferase component Bud32/DNA-directed RNA polymerase subunit RPC12/RpoP
LKVIVDCPECGKHLRLAETYLGKQIRCPGCAQRVTLPEVASSARETPASVLEANETKGVRDTNLGSLASAQQENSQSGSTAEKIGRFELKTTLGKGSFGKVYRAYDPVLDREVALKVPHAGTLENQTAAQRFLREAKAAAQLRHPHIVPVYDAGGDEDEYYIASAFIEGQTLARFIDEERPDFRRSARMVLELAEGLDYAHGLGIVHRDVKPANVMVDEQGQPHVMDFGLARFEGSEEKLTQDGSIMGTPAYISPEQAAKSNEEVTAASDQYSLGVVLYELLCGELPFSGPPQIVVFNVINQPPPAPHTLNPQIPKDLETICLKAMSKEPGGRYADCQELADDLRRWLDDEPIYARRVSRAERLIRWCRREPVVAGLSGSIVVVVLLALVLVTWQWRLAIKAQSDRTLAQAEAILRADIRQVPVIIENLQPFWSTVVGRLEQYLQQDDLSEGERLRLRLALASNDKEHVAHLQKNLLTCQPEELAVIRDALLLHRSEVTNELWSVLSQADATRDRRLRAACALAAFDPDSSKWADTSEFLAETLVASNPLVLPTWLDALRPKKGLLLVPLVRIFRDKRRTESERTLVISILLDLAADQPEILVELLTNADPRQFALVLPKLEAHRRAAVTLLEDFLDTLVSPAASDDERLALAKQFANAAVALLKLKQPEKAWSVLKQSPTPNARTALIHSISRLGVEPQLLIRRLDEEADISIKRALVLALGEFEEAQFSQQDRATALEELLVLYEHVPYPGLHGAAEWLLRQWGAAEHLQTIDRRLQVNESSLKNRSEAETRQWYLTTEGHTMMILEADRYRMGSPASEPGRYSAERPHQRRIGRRFAIASKEVTKAQFRRFQQANSNIRIVRIDQYSQTDDSPQIGVDWYDAVAYCNWLSEQEGIPPAQWCYLPDNDGNYAAGMKPAPDYLTRTGYRLPSEAEWEFACRAGTVTSFYFGTKATLLPKYAWHRDEVDRRSCRPVGKLKPNDFGLFDMLGNANEWCHNKYPRYPATGETDAVDDVPDTETVQDSGRRVVRGGSFRAPPWNVRCAVRFSEVPTLRNLDFGFRPARTYP